MIKPTKITDFNRTKAELEYFWLFCILVAGKNSDIAARKLADLFNKVTDSPFDYIKKEKEFNNHFIHNWLVANKVGQYTRIEKAIEQSLEVDLGNCSVYELMEIHGVGPKTSRFFILHSRKDCDSVILDVHILRYLRDRWGLLDAPEKTPQGADYEMWEKKARHLIRADFPRISMAEADLLIWAKGSGRLEESIIGK